MVTQKHEQRRQKIKRDVSQLTLFFAFVKIDFVFLSKEEIENEKSPPEYRITFGEKPEGITAKEYQLLYIETLYTIKHKIGTTTARHSEGENELYAYAQEAFGLPPEGHQRLLAKASEEKVCFSTFHHRLQRETPLAANSHSQYRNRRSEGSRSERCQW